MKKHTALKQNDKNDTVGSRYLFRQSYPDITRWIAIVDLEVMLVRPL